MKFELFVDIFGTDIHISTYKSSLFCHQQEEKNGFKFQHPKEFLLA